VVSILWADIETRPEILSGPSADQRLPAWVAPLHRLELESFCRACVEHLPRQFGYAELALYVFEPEDRLLALAGTNCRHAVDLAIRVDPGNSHVFAHVARSGSCCVASDLPAMCKRRGWAPPARSPSREQDAVLIAPLMHESALQGLAHFSSPLSGSLAVDGAALDQVRAFLARCIQHAQRYRRARNEARVDPLTGLHNLRAMREALETETRRAQRYHNDLCVIALDLDGLKSVNDHFGHAAGDAVLKHTAAKIRSALRQIDTAARIGGDEFLVMLPGTDLDGARSVGQRMLRMLRDDGPMIGDTRLSLTASLGVAEWSEQCDIQRLLDAADGALYAAKSDGRNRITLADHIAPSDRAPTSV